MSTSEILARPPRSLDGSIFTFDALHLREEDLRAARMRLYHSTGEGFCIFRSFVTPAMVDHMRGIWTTVDPATAFEPFSGKDRLYIGCPNYYSRYDDGTEVFENFLFAPPMDEVTCEVAIAVNMLRNRLSGRNAFEAIYGGQSLGYRVTRTLNRKVWAAPHTDWMDYDRRWEKGQYDPSRLQATLFLSEKGADYGGTGFRFATNGGGSIVFGDDVAVAPGDLVVWRYANLHSIEDVATPVGQLGFLRIIYPIYTLPAAKPPDAPPPPLPARLARYGKALALGVARRILRSVA